MASNSHQPIQGMSDIAPPDIALWQMIEKRAREIFARYRFSEVRTPVLEKLDLFTHSLGDTTDVVTKEMYTLEDRGGRKFALRPEGTAGAIRYVASGGDKTVNARIFYMGPMFRCERPQAGRKRQFHQIGLEAVGAPNPLADAEVIALQIHLLAAWGLEGAKIRLNTIGLPEDRARLFEPYVTTRDKGTGLGLPIVKKIIEEHGGTLSLSDAPVFDGNAHRGALAEMRLPLHAGAYRMPGAAVAE